MATKVGLDSVHTGTPSVGDAMTNTIGLQRPEPATRQHDGLLWVSARAFLGMPMRELLGVGLMVSFLAFWILMLISTSPSRSEATGGMALLPSSFFLVGGVLYTTAKALGRGGRRVVRRFPEKLRLVRVHPALQVDVLLSALALACFGAYLGLAITRLLEDPDKWLHVPAVLYAAGVVAFSVHDLGRTTTFLFRQARAEADAKLSLLQSQLHPHFLFNVLNSLAALVRTDPTQAETMVEEVAHVLRRTVDRTGDRLAPLQEEIDYLRSYLAVEQRRWGARLRVQWALDEKALAVPVPPLCLQPLVENALKHGLSERLEGGTITIGVALEPGRLILYVRDDGVGLPRAVREGTGLSNLRERLVSLYGGEGTLGLERAENGTLSLLGIPLQTGRGSRQ